MCVPEGENEVVEKLSAKKLPLILITPAVRRPVVEPPLVVKSPVTFNVSAIFCIVNVPLDCVRKLPDTFAV